MLFYKSNKNIRLLLVCARLPYLDCEKEATSLTEFNLEYTSIPNTKFTLRNEMQLDNNTLNFTILPLL